MSATAAVIKTCGPSAKSISRSTPTYTSRNTATKSTTGVFLNFRIFDDATATFYFDSPGITNAAQLTSELPAGMSIVPPLASLPEFTVELDAVQRMRAGEPVATATAGAAAAKTPENEEKGVTDTKKQDEKPNKKKDDNDAEDEEATEQQCGHDHAPPDDDDGDGTPSIGPCFTMYSTVAAPGSWSLVDGGKAVELIVPPKSLTVTLTSAEDFSEVSVDSLDSQPLRVVLPVECVLADFVLE